MSARMTDAEAREIVKIAYAGRIAEDWLHRISRDEGQAIHPDPAGAQGDLKLADSVLIEHGLQGERETLWAAAQDAVGDYALALGVWAADHFLRRIKRAEAARQWFCGVRRLTSRLQGSVR